MEIVAKRPLVTYIDQIVIHLLAWYEWDGQDIVLFTFKMNNLNVTRIHFCQTPLAYFLYFFVPLFNFSSFFHFLLFHSSLLSFLLSPPFFLTSYIRYLL